MATTLGGGTQTAAAAGIGTFLDTGSLVVYSGAAPANAKAALSGNTVLATHTLAGFSESGGTITANSIASATIAATGMATFARILVSGTAEWQGVIGTDITVTPDANYVQNGTSNITSLTITVPDA